MSLLRNFRKMFRHRSFEKVLEANKLRLNPIELTDREWREIHIICFWGKCVYDKDGHEKARHDKPDDPRIELLSNMVSKFNRRQILEFFSVPIFRRVFIKSFAYLRHEVQFTNNPKMGKGEVPFITSDQFNVFKDRLYAVALRLNNN